MPARTLDWNGEKRASQALKAKLGDEHRNDHSRAATARATTSRAVASRAATAQGCKEFPLHSILQSSPRLTRVAEFKYALRSIPTRALVQTLQARRRTRVTRPSVLQPPLLLRRLHHRANECSSCRLALHGRQAISWGLAKLVCSSKKTPPHTSN